MAKTRAQKEEITAKITEKLKKAKSLVFTDFKGLTMSELSQLRDKLREQSAEFSVTKNTLLKLALKEAGKEGLTDDVLEGPVATLFSYDDAISPIKTLAKSLKELAKGRIKAGFLGEELMDQFKVTTLAALPSKLELQGKLVGVLVAPLSGMVNVLQANIRNLVYVLNEIKTVRGGE